MKPTAKIALALAATLIVGSLAFPLHAEELSGKEIKTITLRVAKNANGWVRILKGGVLIALTASDAHALGLSPTDSVGKVVEVIAVDTKNDAVELGQDLATLGQYVAVDVAMPLISDGYTYTGNVIVPKAAEWSKKSYAYTKETIIPETGKALKTGAVSAYEGAKSFYKWATD